MEKKFGVDYSSGRYIPINIQTMNVGPATFVIFEIPGSKEEVPQMPPIKLSK